MPGAADNACKPGSPAAAGSCQLAAAALPPHIAGMLQGPSHGCGNLDEPPHMHTSGHIMPEPMLPMHAATIVGGSKARGLAGRPSAHCIWLTAAARAGSDKAGCVGGRPRKRFLPAWRAAGRRRICRHKLTSARAWVEECFGASSASLWAQLQGVMLLIASPVLRPVV